MNFCQELFYKNCQIQPESKLARAGPKPLVKIMQIQIPTYFQALLV